MDLSDTPRPPPCFYRVHHDKSFTMFDEEGFGGQGHYLMNYHQWITPKKFHKHLDWSSLPVHITPFISVFGNKADAMKRVQHHVSRGDTSFILAEITTHSLRESVLEIESGGENMICLPVWEDSDGFTFISTAELRRHIGVQVSLSQRSEWFAINYIPATMIRETTPSDECC